MLIGQWEHCSYSAFVGGGGREGGGWGGGFIGGGWGGGFIGGGWGDGFIGVRQEEIEGVESCKNKKEKWF